MNENPEMTPRGPLTPRPATGGSSLLPLLLGVSLLLLLASFGIGLATRDPFWFGLHPAHVGPGFTFCFGLACFFIAGAGRGQALLAGTVLGGLSLMLFALPAARLFDSSLAPAMPWQDRLSASDWGLLIAGLAVLAAALVTPVGERESRWTTTVTAWLIPVVVLGPVLVIARFFHPPLVELLHSPAPGLTMWGRCTATSFSEVAPLFLVLGLLPLPGLVIGRLVGPCRSLQESRFAPSVLSASMLFAALTLVVAKAALVPMIDSMAASQLKFGFYPALPWELLKLLAIGPEFLVIAIGATLLIGIPSLRNNIQDAGLAGLTAGLMILCGLTSFTMGAWVVADGLVVVLGAVLLVMVLRSFSALHPAEPSTESWAEGIAPVLLPGSLVAGFVAAHPVSLAWAIGAGYLPLLTYANAGVGGKSPEALLAEISLVTASWPLHLSLLAAVALAVLFFFGLGALVERQLLGRAAGPAAPGEPEAILE